MKLSPPSSGKRRGFLLLEVVLALAIFGIAATAFAVAINQIAHSASLAQKELRITRILESALDEAVSLPTLEEGTTSTAVPDTGVELDTTVELIENLESEEGQLLQQMYRVKVTAHWFNKNVWDERTVETWRFGRMYQP